MNDLWRGGYAVLLGLLVAPVTGVVVPPGVVVVPPGVIGSRPSTTATFLRKRFDCTDDEVLRAERHLPPNLVDPGIEPVRAGDVCESLQPRLSLTEPELRKMVLVRPHVLGCNYESNIAPSLAALQSRLSLSDAELKKLVTRHPQVLGYSVEAKIKPLLAALQSRLSLGEPELKKLVLGHPQVLSYSFEANIEPKLAFLQTAFSLAPDELRESMLTNPALLSRSLELRYRPRVALASALGVVVAREAIVPAGMYTDARYMAWLRRRDQAGLADDGWAALCALPLVERAAGVHGPLC